MGYRENYFAENKGNNGWYTCVRCGKKLRKKDVDVDHIVPQHYGGSDNARNLQCMCKHCNRSKQASLSDTIPDYIKNNATRTIKKIFNLK